MDKATMQEAQSALDPQGPAQPDLNTAYEVKGNAASKEPAEQAKAQENSTQPSDPSTDSRVPTKQTSYVLLNPAIPTTTHEPHITAPAH